MEGEGNEWVMQQSTSYCHLNILMFYPHLELVMFIKICKSDDCLESNTVAVAILQLTSLKSFPNTCPIVRAFRTSNHLCNVMIEDDF
jgi:hypothetical protein